MKGFAKQHTKRVIIDHGEKLELVLTALPYGYREAINTAMPKPADEAELSRWSVRLVFVLMAKHLGDQVDAVAPPPGSPTAAWEAYADAIETEFQAAHLIESDLQTLMAAMDGLSRGIGDLPNG